MPGNRFLTSSIKSQYKERFWSVSESFSCPTNYCCPCPWTSIGGVRNTNYWLWFGVSCTFFQGTLQGWKEKVQQDLDPINRRPSHCYCPVWVSFGWLPTMPRGITWTKDQASSTQPNCGVPTKCLCIIQQGFCNKSRAIGTWGELQPVFQFALFILPRSC